MLEVLLVACGERRCCWLLAVNGDVVGRSRAVGEAGRPLLFLFGVR